MHKKKILAQTTILLRKAMAIFNGKVRAIFQSYEHNPSEREAIVGIKNLIENPFDVISFMCLLFSVFDTTSGKFDKSWHTGNIIGILRIAVA